jgi:NADH-quinone oxidoreductase subunit J
MLWDFERVIMVVLGGFTMISGLAVISERNPVHSVFFLVLAFCQSAGLLVLVGAEFMAMMVLIVYVGAIAVLFLFVVMMLTTQTETMTKTWVPLGMGLAMILLIQVIGLAPGWPSTSETSTEWTPTAVSWLDLLISQNNVEALGNYLYTYGFPYFMIAGLLLWVSMIGAIALTLHRREYVKKQEISYQVSRQLEDSLLLKVWSKA